MNNVNITSVFSEFISTTKMSLDNSLLETACLNLLNGKEAYEFNGAVNKEFEELFEQVHKLFNEIAIEIYKITDKYQINLEQAWINRGGREFSLPHEHPGFHLSAVYYVNANPNKSSISFLRPAQQIIKEKYSQLRNDAVIEELNEFNSSICTIPSVTGNLLIFPSWLMHFVMNNGDNTRISIAFNGKLIKKEKFVFNDELKWST
jgi:uncharacterized protein (TIGR02466 family)